VYCCFKLACDVTDLKPIMLSNQPCNTITTRIHAATFDYLFHKLTCSLSAINSCMPYIQLTIKFFHFSLLKLTNYHEIKTGSGCTTMKFVKTERSAKFSLELVQTERSVIFKLTNYHEIKTGSGCTTMHGNHRRNKLLKFVKPKVAPNFLWNSFRLNEA
jgi:hypothetical protein